MPSLSKHPNNATKGVVTPEAEGGPTTVDTTEVAGAATAGILVRCRW